MLDNPCDPETKDFTTSFAIGEARTPWSGDDVRAVWLQVTVFLTKAVDCEEICQ